MAHTKRSLLHVITLSLFGCLGGLGVLLMGASPSYSQTTKPSSQAAASRPTSRPVKRVVVKPAVPESVLARRASSRPVTRRAAPTTRPVVRKVSPRPKARTLQPLRRKPPVVRKTPVARKPPVRRQPLYTEENPIEMAPPFPSVAGLPLLTLGKTLSQTSPVGTVSWARLKVSQPGWYLLDTLGKSDPFCRLYGESFALLARNDDSGAKRNCRILKYLKKGTYFWEVMLFPYKSVTFQLLARKLRMGSLPLKRWVRSSIKKKGTLRLFQASIAKPGYYSVSTKGPTDVLCAQLVQQGPANSFTAQDDDSGPSTNCDMRVMLEKGQHTFLVKGAYFKRKGKFSIRIKPMTEQRVEFHAVTFGETMRARLGSSSHRHRYHFRLAQATRVSFLVRYRRNLPQVRLLDVNNKLLAHRSYAVDSLGRIRVLSQTLQAGEYYLELRSPGKPRYPYELWAYKDRAVDLPSNRAQLLSQGVPSTDETPSYQYALFRVKLKAGSHFVISSEHPRVSACVLEKPSGEMVVTRRSSRAEPGVCRLKGFGLQGTFWVRVMLGSQTLRYPKPFTEALTALSQKLTSTSSSIQALFQQWLQQQRQETKKPRKGLPLLNPSDAPQIRMYQFVPKLVAQTETSQAKPSQTVAGFQINVRKPDLYLISARGRNVADCRVLDLLFRFLKQATITPQGCEVAAYLLHGSYMLRVTTANDSPIRVTWRTFRSRPRVLNKDGVVVGPLRKGMHHDVSVRITKPDFYLLYSQLVSSVSLVTRLKLYKGLKQIAKYSVKPYAVLAYLKKGVYRLRVNIKNGRGAFSLFNKRIVSKVLKVGGKQKGVLTEKAPRHFFRIQSQGGSLVRIETTGEADTYCWLFDQKGTRVARNNNSGKGPNCRMDRVLKQGVYLLEVGVVRNRGGSFQVSARSITLKPMTTLVIGKAFSSRLRSRKDVHRYRIRIRRPGMYVIATRNPSGTRTDPKCYLYEQGRLRRFNDDSGPRFNCSIVQKLKRGTYTLVIKLAWSTRKGPYKVAIYRAGTPFPGTKAKPKARPRKRPVARRPPATRRVLPATGWVLQPGQRVQALVVRKTRVDVYKLRIRYSGRYTIVTDGNLDTKCYLDDSQGNAMLTNEDGGPAANCKLSSTLGAGLYTIRILARPVGRLGPYGLRIVVE
ncbi:MAG: hypothetical protein EP343_10040 [Deltaproteobacteria bacterium]|nr:MAG: hypothetical protein EP343_10040 [Deltaproteobacteria bacterium]